MAATRSMIPWLEQNDPFPAVETALTEESGFPGLLAASADLSPDRLVNAYRQGIFPWFSENQPVLWWSTDPRMVLPTEHFVISHSLKKKLRQIHKSIHTGGPWKLKFDADFGQVIKACAAPRNHIAGTWITDEIIDNYQKLHEMGIAHSSELWYENRLVGGAYGICLGKIFFGESMFARVRDASKIALSHLVFFLKMNGVKMIDCQQETAHLASLGARPISRADFTVHLKSVIDLPPVTSWKSDNLCPLCSFHTISR
ncbi:leucyl/phenylalanyl-tRNA-protein transferase [Oxalobacter formigenes HOxBLS]|uniref:Leucyl/phenylalanyl-tRNA--protein transferase n=2 Tax=Oxalobacter paraformigenes TaxID=556268 RepID=C3X521_9BURK|nr:leucyl/phenylalanyl-tRNA-protein transferase [Oxalobacter paraformigenes]